MTARSEHQVQGALTSSLKNQSTVDWSEICRTFDSLTSFPVSPERSLTLWFPLSGQSEASLLIFQSETN